MNLLSPIATVIAAAVLFASIGTLWWWRARRPRRPPPLPREWSLAPRPVFTNDERRLYRSLREALPHHVVLAKLPLVRFCQPIHPDEIAYWFELLGGIHVTFAVCSLNGRVLAAIDLDTERGHSRRVTQIKQAVLGTCRVRYLRCPVDQLPSIAELQLLVPQNGQTVRAPQPIGQPVAPPIAPAAASSSPSRHGMFGLGRRDLWHHSSFFQDSFFAPERDRDATESAAPSGVSSPDAASGLPPPGTRTGLGPGRAGERSEPRFDPRQDPRPVPGGGVPRAGAT